MLLIPQGQEGYRFKRCWFCISLFTGIFLFEEMILLPKKPKKPCKHPGCPMLTDDNYCELHRREHGEDRPKTTDRGYNSRWRKARNIYLKEHPLCAYCMKEGKYTKATVVDHIIPHRGDKKLFWDESNWQSLCKSCHDKKTMTEDRYLKYRY